ncbi:MAG: DUF1559 domain-containing protein [Verrucomicrobiae bacterium]|nr:DUF1559 domain-containing protein [Verrucomicrobiae bacterium]
MNNLRNIGVGTALFLSDFQHYPTRPGGASDWTEQLMPYIVHGNYDRISTVPAWQQNGQAVDRDYVRARWSVFQCPSAPKPALTPFAYQYACNYLVFNSPTGSCEANDSSALDSRFSDVVLAAESGVNTFTDNNASADLSNVGDMIYQDFLNDPAGAPTRGNLPVITPASDWGWPSYAYHNGKAQAVFADGHVRAFTNGELLRRNFSARCRLSSIAPPGVIVLYYP